MDWKRMDFADRNGCTDHNYSTGYTDLKTRPDHIDRPEYSSISGCPEFSGHMTRNGLVGWSVLDPLAATDLSEALREDEHLYAVNRFNALFPDQDACIAFARRLKWPNGFHCYACGHREAYEIASKTSPLLECRNCKHQTSLTAHTIMHKSRTPLRKWLLSMFMVACCGDGINALKLSSLINVTYKTAWSILHKIRSSISDMDHKRKMAGIVEAKHEIFMKKFIPSADQLRLEHSVIAAKETAFSDRTPETEYYKLKIVPRRKAARSPLSDNEAAVFAESHLSADTRLWRINPRMQWLPELRAAYNKIRSGAVVSEDEQLKISDLLKNSLSVFADQAFKWLNRTFHGIGIKYAQKYLDEYCFRRNAANQGQAFQWLVRNAFGGQTRCNT